MEGEGRREREKFKKGRKRILEHYNMKKNFKQKVRETKVQERKGEKT